MASISTESPVELFDKGWYRFARHLESPNRGSRPQGGQIDLLVIHSISLPPGQFGTGCVQELFVNRLCWDSHPYFQSIRGLEVSSHFFITRLGELWQFVSVNDRAWHAGVSSYRGRANCNDDSIGIELEGLDDGGFEDSQYETLSELMSALIQHWPIQHVAGHEHIAPGRKRDPGPGFDWGRLRKALSLPAQCFPESSA